MDDTHALSFPPSFQCQIKHIPAKRIFDVTFSFLILLLALPLVLCLCFLISVSLRGNPLYAHQRIGRGGKPFRCYKFRTMYKDADLRLQHLLETDPSIREEWQKNYKLQHDPRITPVGRVLRKFSLDELPQFFNVLKGDLSVVGPRPVIEEEVRQHLGPKAAKILSIRPGITGIWQVSGRSNTSYSRRVQLDEQYVDSHSLFLDIKLILKTLPAVMLSRGAY